jgi:hypothetical protein
MIDEDNAELAEILKGFSAGSALIVLIPNP